MYTPKQFQHESSQELINTIKSIHFGALIVFTENRFYSSQIPFLISL